MSIRGLLRRTVLPAIVLGTSATVAALHGPFTELKFKTCSYAVKLFQFLDPEVAHNWTVWAGSKGLFPKDSRPDPPSLNVQFWGRTFSNPLGLAAGFDKNAESMQAMLDMGFAFVEIGGSTLNGSFQLCSGSVTPLPQDGNPKPRVFRIPQKKAVINRYGFNSDGVDAVERRLASFRKLNLKALIGVNLGINKDNASDWRTALRDYILGVRQLGHFADYLVINISSPNTKGTDTFNKLTMPLGLGLRALQSQKEFKSLVLQVRKARDEMKWSQRGPPPILVKIAPDLTEQDKIDIAKVALHGDFDGLIISNTTITRQGVGQYEVSHERGGMSGQPLFDPSTALLKEMYSLTEGSVPIIGCGGISSGRQAYEKIKAGATLIQLYTAMVYDGPSLIPKIKSELLECLKQDHYNEVSKAIGAQHRK